MGVDGWSVIEGEIKEGREGISEGGKEVERERERGREREEEIEGARVSDKGRGVVRGIE